jgi:hypothetical protein
MNRLIVLLCLLLFNGKTFSQTDSLNKPVKKQTFFVSAGISMPISTGFASRADGYAKNGFTTISTYSNQFYKMLEFSISHVFMVNKINTSDLANNLKTTIESQVNNKLNYTSAKSSDWINNALVGGIGIRKALNQNGKLVAFANIQAGIAYVFSPSTETFIQIDQLFYSTRVKRTKNFAPAFGGNIGINYMFTPKTGIIFNTNFSNINLNGNNLEVTEIGNNSYESKMYYFEQKISSLNFSLGISTHF